MSTKLNSDNQVRRVVILGGGTAGWMTAAALATLLPQQQYSITLIESDRIGTVGVGEATLPHLRFFNQRLGIDERDFMRQTHATFKLGIEFSHWGALGDAYLHPFGEYGVDVNQLPFHQMWCHAKHRNLSEKICDYSLPVVMAKAHKFAFPSAEKTSLMSTFSYAYHIDATAYAAFLRQLAQTRGALRLEGEVSEVVQHCNGDIASVIVDGQRPIMGDFFIDCSGFRSLLLGKTLNQRFTSWSKWLPCDRAVAVQSQHGEHLPAYTRAIAQPAGWQWQIPLQHRMGNGHVYSSAHMSDSDALDTLLQALPGDAIQSPNQLRFEAGKREMAWSHNCVAIGLSSGFLEPLESTSIYLVQAAIMKLVSLFPQCTDMAIERDEFNRTMNIEMERIRDFLILHYHATSRVDTPFWQYCQSMSIPESLADKIAMFKDAGFIESYQHGLFLEPSWVAVYLGQGIMPERVAQHAQYFSDTQLHASLERLSSRIVQTVAQQPSHQQALRAFLSQQASNNSAPSNNLYGRKVS